MNCYIRKKIEKCSIFSLFLGIFIIFALSVLMVSIVTNGNSFKDMFLLRGAAFCSDFFQPLRDDFNVRGDIYPPLSYLWFYFMDKVVKFANSICDIGGYIVYYIEIGISIIVCYFLIKKHFKINEKLFVLMIVASLPFLFLCERGNVLLLIIPLVIYFLCNYNSEDRKTRIVSYIILGICVGFKPYLVLLGLLVLRERKIRDVAICLVIGALLFFLPFLYTEPNGFSIWIDTLINHSGKMSLEPHQDYVNLQNTLMMIFTFFGWGYSSNVMGIIPFLILIPMAMIIIFYSNIEKWKLVTLMMLTILLLTSFKPIYTLLFLIVPLLLFFESNQKLNRSNAVYTICFLLSFVPMVEFFYYFTPSTATPISTIIESFAILIIFIIIIAEIIVKEYLSVTKMMKRNRE